MASYHHFPVSVAVVMMFLADVFVPVLLLHVFDHKTVLLHCRKRLDATLQDLEEKQNSKKDAVCVLPFLMFLNCVLMMPVPPLWWFSSSDQL